MFMLLPVALTRIEMGNLSSVKGIGDGVLEYRIHFGAICQVGDGTDSALSA